MMNCDLQNRVKKIPLSKRDLLNPIFEAVNNSLQSIDNLEKPYNGEISVEFLYNNGLFGDNDSNCFLRSILIEDNGVGFDEKNFNSFNILDSSFKRAIGGKGVGRLTWLTCFNNVEIKSNYFENGSYWNRTFCFNSQNGVYQNKEENIESNSSLKTSITLVNPKSEYVNLFNYSEEDIIDKFLNKFIGVLLNNSCPKITIKVGDNSTVLNDKVKERVIDKKNEISISLGNMSFEGNAYIIKGIEDKHKIILTSQGLTIKEFDLETFIDLPSELNGGKLKFFVSGSPLDEDINETRTDFINFCLQKKQAGIFEDYNLYNPVITAVQDFIKPYLEKHNEEKFNLTFEYIKTKAPQYAYMLSNNKKELTNIPLKNIKDIKKLDTELYIIDRNVSSQNESKMDYFLKSKDLINENEIKSLAEMISDSAKVDLTKYVIRRDKIIDILDKVLGFNDNDNYDTESILHNLFVPQRTDPSHLRYDDHNLWLIDERLAFDYYIFSEKKLSDVSPNINDANKRPDILFVKALSFTKDNTRNSIKNITIVEFKRPGRDDYTDSENPISQVNHYLYNISESKSVKGLDGKVCTIDDNATFHAYIIADLTESLIKMAKLNSYKKLPDNNGYYFFNSELRAQIEIIPYSKIVENARIRNKAFMNKIEKDLIDLQEKMEKEKLSKN